MQEPYYEQINHKPSKCAVLHRNQRWRELFFTSGKTTMSFFHWKLWLSIVHRGGFEKVHKGHINGNSDSNQHVAIKRLESLSRKDQLSSQHKLKCFHSCTPLSPCVLIWLVFVQNARKWYLFTSTCLMEPFSIIFTMLILLYLGKIISK